MRLPSKGGRILCTGLRKASKFVKPCEGFARRQLYNKEMRRIASLALLSALIITACGEQHGPAVGPGNVVASVPIAQLSFNPAAIVGGQSGEGTITLSGAAPAGGVGIVLSSTDAAAAVPASVSVPAGAVSATFTVTTRAVTSTTEVTIGATAGSSTHSTVLRVSPAGPRLVGFAVDPSVGGGQTSSAAVEIDAPAPGGGAQVSVSASNGTARVPSLVTIPAGAVRATFSIPTQAVTSVVQIVFTASYGGATLEQSMMVRPAAMRSFEVRPFSIIGGSPATATLTLDVAAPAEGTIITLMSNTEFAVVPEAVRVPGGSASVTFTIITKPVGGAGYATFRATLGSETLRAILYLLPGGSLPLPEYSRRPD
jgi:hypothetical protein